MPRPHSAIRDTIRYATRTRGSGGFIRSVGRRLGGNISRLLSSVAEVLAGGRRVTQRHFTDAEQILREAGFGTPVDIMPPSAAHPEGSLQRTIRPQRPVSTGFRSPAARGQEPPEHDIDTRRVALAGGMSEGQLDWVETPGSSNVYSFAYDADAGILYIRYKAGAALLGEGHPRKNQCTGKVYSLRSKPHSPGPLYAYGSAARPVPHFIYDRLRAASSKGGEVWRSLRVCGSSHRHQYPYTLASVPGDRPYVPRKAVEPSSRHPLGFRVRTVPVVGRGRRGFYESTLDEFGNPNPGRYRSGRR